MSGNVSVNSKGAHLHSLPPPRPRQQPGHLNFSKKIVKSPPMWVELHNQMPNCQGTEK